MACSAAHSLLFGLRAGLFGGALFGFGGPAAFLIEARLLGGAAGLLLGFGLALRGGGALVGQLLLGDFTEGDDARVLGHLGGLAGIGFGALAVVALVQEIAGVAGG